jgi:excisionase family DNA binding protein
MSLLTVNEVALRLRATPRTIRGRIADGTLRATKPAGRWLIDEADLSADLTETESRPTRRRRRRSA